jgi:hypothetical protein
LTASAGTGKKPNHSSGPWAPTDNSPRLPQIKGTADIKSALKMADVDKLHALGVSDTEEQFTSFPDLQE